MAKKRDRSTGRDGISRRDFLDGVAVSAAGLAAAAASPHLTGAEAMIAGHGGTTKPLPPGYYPPTSTGITGQPDNVIRDTIKIDGFPQPGDVHSTQGGPGIFTLDARDVDNDYDLVVVGPGRAGSPPRSGTRTASDRSPSATSPRSWSPLELRLRVRALLDVRQVAGRPVAQQPQKRVVVDV